LLLGVARQHFERSRALRLSSKSHLLTAPCAKTKLLYVTNNFFSLSGFNDSYANRGRDMGYRWVGSMEVRCEMEVTCSNPVDGSCDRECFLFNINPSTTLIATRRHPSRITNQFPHMALWFLTWLDFPALPVSSLKWKRRRRCTGCRPRSARCLSARSLSRTLEQAQRVRSGSKRCYVRAGSHRTTVSDTQVLHAPCALLSWCTPPVSYPRAELVGRIGVFGITRSVGLVLSLANRDRG
jgi:hypothetical protein